MPDYDCSEYNHVSLKIPGQVININYSLMLMENSYLDLLTTMWLDCVQKKKTIHKDVAVKLKKLKLVEGRYPNLIISKRIAKDTHTEIEYTDLKGFDDKYYRDFIIKALQQHGKLRRTDFNKGLLPKLPSVLSDEQKIRKVGNLLTALRKEGKILSTADRFWIIND
jgi:ATP-dependent DNA helicase RecG